MTLDYSRVLSFLFFFCFFLSFFLPFFLSFFLSFSSPFFLILVFFLCCFVSVHIISILPSLCPNNFYFPLLNYSYSYFSTLQTYVLSQPLLFLNQLIFHLLRVLSIQFPSYFVINNVMLFDVRLSFKTGNMSLTLEPIVLTSVLIWLFL